MIMTCGLYVYIYAQNLWIIRLRTYIMMVVNNLWIIYAGARALDEDYVSSGEQPHKWETEELWLAPRVSRDRIQARRPFDLPCS